MTTEAHGQPGLEQTIALRRRVSDYHKNLTQKQRAIGGLDTLPWHLLPSIDHLQSDESLPKARANGRHRPDGKFITPAMLAETKIVLGAFVNCLRELGEGGSGYVDEVKDVTVNKIYARKLWRCTGRSAREAEFRLEEEVQILKKLLSHNHIIQLVNTYRRENMFGLVMSPVAKASLYDIMELPSDERAWARPVLRRSPGCLTSALADIHSLKTRHKDITPKNILICDDDVILTDFGISVDPTLSKQIEARLPN
ncbi:hypothetical protein SLS55_002226 [Diplodia seriata]|uniref:Protein kinase domain-containing protein n=1 Tax=Diplodia seriata TaxID=420778 RepID=A0ABR3CRK8_9PEZI